MTDVNVIQSAPHRALDPAAFDLYPVTCLGMPLVAGRFENAAALLDAAARNSSGDTLIAAHINLANFHTLHRHPPLMQELQRHALLFLDGIGLKVAVAMLGDGWIEDVNGTDLFPMVMERLARRGGTVYFVGSTPEVVDEVARATTVRYPGLEVVGWEHGYFNRDDEGPVVQRIHDAHPDVLLVGCGFGKQEEFALRHRDAFGASLVWTVGGLFDMVSGHAPRAPLWMRRLRLEWMFRFAREPRRMFHRNVISPPWVFARVIKSRMRGQNA